MSEKEYYKIIYAYEDGATKTTLLDGITFSGIMAEAKPKKIRCYPSQIEFEFEHFTITIDLRPELVSV